MWHGLSDYPGREAAIATAGHGWRVLEAPLTADLGDGPVEVTGYKALYRSDTKGVIATVRSTYEPVQNATLWDIVDALMAGGVRYETAGVLKQGAVVWVLGRLDEPSVVSQDASPIYPFVLVSSRHDGQGACKAACVSVRVVCWNTFSRAEEQAGRAGTSYSFRHTRHVMDYIEEAKVAIGLIRGQHQQFMALAGELADHAVSDAGAEEFIRKMFPDVPAPTARMRNYLEHVRGEVTELLAGPTVPEAHRRTSYGLFCAGTEYLDHLMRARTPETRFGRAMFEGTAVKQRVAKLALSVN